MKNIGVIVDNEFNTDIRVRKEVEILKKQNFSVHVLCFGFDGKQYPDVEGVSITRIPIKKSIKDGLFFLFNRFPLYEYLWTKHIKKFILHHSIDVLHVHDLYLSKATHKAIKKTQPNIPMILDLHENFPEAIQLYNWTKGTLRNWLSKPKAWLKKEKEYLSYANQIIVLSESFKQNLIERYPFLKEKNIVAFPNVIDLRAFEQYPVNENIKNSNHITLFYFGGIAERRGIFDTIEVFEEALKKHPSLELLFIGPVDKADKPRFLNAIQSEKVASNIKHIPWIDISELPTYLHSSDIFLSPLHKNKQHESGIANKLFQYMFGGKPIIVSNCKPQKELIETNECGLSFSTNEEFLECILRLVEDRELRHRLGKNAYEKLYEKYDTKAYENILLSLY